MKAVIILKSDDGQDHVQAVVVEGTDQADLSARTELVKTTVEDVKAGDPAGYTWDDIAKALVAIGVEVPDRTVVPGTYWDCFI